MMTVDYGSNSISTNMDDMINEQRFIQIVAWNSILDEKERITARKMYEDNLKLAMQQSEENNGEEMLLIRSRIASSGTICALDHQVTNSGAVFVGNDDGQPQRQSITPPPSTPLSSSETSMSSFVAELELAIQVSSQDQALRHEEEERRRLADEIMIADLSALISDEEENERRARDLEYEAEMELVIQQSEQHDPFHSF